MLPLNLGYYKTHDGQFCLNGLGTPSDAVAAMHSEPNTIDPTWNYEEAVSRNLGLISPDEQQHLRHCRVAIPGMGGVGGNHLMTLTRMGIGKFRIADADEFEVKNLKRQIGATLESLGQSKADVMSAATWPVCCLGPMFGSTRRCSKTANSPS